MTLIETLRRKIGQRRSYNRTRRELSRMPLDVALDLDLAREDADKIARQCVYGR
ncbi:hypothetical protein [Salipiger sp. IMCC34102]|uniref:hypothetical protein n=1 Tax=Salipiger sp. IMCC34102 TaxID=2510647 RepID=UPI0013EA16FC|nr:hypothetical protein [Salipiger sp. IMCC34102]